MAELTGSVTGFGVVASCCDIANWYLCAASLILVAAGTSAIIASVTSAEDIMIMLQLGRFGLYGFKRKGACAH
jgi:hypothetical protein